MANVYVRSGASGAGTGADWTNAYTTLAAALTAKAAGDTFYVAADHAETQASAMTLTPPGTAASWNRIVCVDHAGSVPPVSADLRTTATVSTSGANGMSFTGGYAYIRGITFDCASGSGVGGISLLGQHGSIVFDQCHLNQNSTSTNTMTFGGSAQASTRIELIDTPIGFGSTNQFISIRNARVIWRGPASNIAGTVPTDLFKTSSRGGTVMIEGVDLSAAGSGKTLIGSNVDPCQFYIKDCKLNAAVTIAGAQTSQGAAEIYVTRSDSSATNYRAEKYNYAGAQTTETTLVMTSGATTGTTSFSAKLVASTGAAAVSPFEALPLAAYNTVTGSSVTVTLEGIWNSASLPNNDDVWIDIEGLGTSGSPLGVFATSGKANVLASSAALTASTQAWDSLTGSRANSSAYVLGDMVKTASNAGRVFFCTTAGTSAGSEPAGYASAVDGGSVTDGTAVFRAARRFNMSASFTPQVAGALYAYPKVGLASATLWLDQKLTLS